MQGHEVHSEPYTPQPAGVPRRFKLLVAIALLSFAFGIMRHLLRLQFTSTDVGVLLVLIAVAAFVVFSFRGVMLRDPLAHPKSPGVGVPLAPETAQPDNSRANVED